MTQVKILISHAHDEKALAEAWKNLLTTISLDGLQVWFSSDVNPGGGMDVGGQWREQLYKKLDDSHFIIAIQTPTSAGRPWIMWECGVASGIGGERGLIPIVFSMGRGDLANPLTTYQVYDGEDKGQVLEICNRLLSKTQLKLNAGLFDQAFETYKGAISLHRPRKAIKVEQMVLWKTRFEELARLGRFNELPDKRKAMYATLGQPFKPVEPTLHELLSKILLDHKHYNEAIEEVDFAISLVGEDIDLMHRKALALVESQNLPDAEKIINKVLTDHPDFKDNPELASLEGRIHRERWRNTGDREHLDKAFAAYNRACQADPTQYYPCINAASLALTQGDIDKANQLFTRVFTICQELQKRPVVSYWVDFTAGEALLGMGKIQEALAEYERAKLRTPSPPPRDRESALNGARRMADTKGLSKNVVESIEQVLKT